jgi:DNA-binding GntR family transcriptional regulator
MADRSSSADGRSLPSGRGATRTLTAVHRNRLETFSHPNLKDKAAAYLRNEILNGRLRPGEKIDQEQVADVLGISRLPVREALIELTQENLVDSVPRRGSFVARIDKDDIRDLYEIQGHVAGIAARRAATELTDDQLVALREIHGQFLDAKGSDDQGDISFAFYQLILDAGGSNRLRALLRRLYQSLPVDYFELVPSWFDQTAGYHEELLVALEARDGAAAADAMHRFLEATGLLAVDLLAEHGLWDDEERTR